jgi:hypothetical protein
MNKIILKIFDKHDKIDHDLIILKQEKMNFWSPSPMLTLFNNAREKLKLDNDTYILCVYYNKPVQVRRSQPDYQLGMTGTGTIKDIPLDTLRKEMAEELGLCFDPKYTKKSINYHERLFYYKKKQTWDLYAIDIRNLSPCPKYRHLEKIQNVGRDNYRFKVGCIVYGSYNDIKAYLSKDKMYKIWDGKNGYESEGIIGISYKYATHKIKLNK